MEATNSLITKAEKSAKDYLKNNYNTDVRSYPQHEVKNIYRKINKNIDCKFKFLNDDIKLKNSKNNFASKKIIETLPLGFLDDDTLKSLEYYKGLLIKNSKSFDLARSGTISKDDSIKALMNTNINKIDYNVAKAIIDSYNKTENVEYMKFIAQLIKDSHLTLLKKNCKSNFNINYLNNSSSKRENNFGNNDLLSSTTGFNNNKTFLSQEKKMKLKKCNSGLLEEDKKQKDKNFETNIQNRKTLNHSFSNLLNRTYGGDFLFNRQREND